MLSWRRLKDLASRIETFSDFPRPISAQTHFLTVVANACRIILVYIFTRDVIRRGISRLKELVDQILHYIKKYNEVRGYPLK